MEFRPFFNENLKSPQVIIEPQKLEAFVQNIPVEINCRGFNFRGCTAEQTFYCTKIDIFSHTEKHILNFCPTAAQTID